MSKERQKNERRKEKEKNFKELAGIWFLILCVWQGHDSCGQRKVNFYKLIILQYQCQEYQGDINTLDIHIPFTPPW